MKETKHKKVLTRNDLANSLMPQVGTWLEAYEFVGKFFDTFSDAIVQNDELKVHGFGVFRCIEKNKRVGRNPKTGVEAEVSSRRVVSFIAGNKFKTIVRIGNERL